MARPRKYQDPVESTFRCERTLRERLSQHVDGRMEMNDVLERALVEYLDRHERPLVDDPRRGLSDGWSAPG